MDTDTEYNLSYINLIFGSHQQTHPNGKCHYFNAFFISRDTVCENRELLSWSIIERYGAWKPYRNEDDNYYHRAIHG